MGSRNVWILLAVVLALGGAVLWQLGREERREFDADRPLFDDVRAERVQSVHLDHLEQGLQLTLQRDANGSWQIVDPLAYPAEGGVLERLFEVVQKNRAIPVDKPDLSKLSLSPPRAVLELVERLPAGERKLRLELGAKDDDGKHVFARVEGRVVRTLLNLDSTLDRDLSGWRQHRVLTVDPASVVELRRHGRFALEPDGTVTDFAFEAGTTETGWRATKPWNAALDPGAVGALLTNLCYLQARGFLADSAVEAAAYGLDHPDLRIELGIAGGAEEALLFRHDARSESWCCMREGSTHVLRVDDAAVTYLAIPSDAFLDPKLVRFVRDEVQLVELAHGATTLRLARDGKIWKLGSFQGTTAGPDVRADTEAVLDLLGALEGAHAAKFLLDEGPQGFAPSEPPIALRLTWRGQVTGVEFGAAREAAPGTPGRLFRRAGEDLAGLVEARTAELVAQDWAHFVDRQLVKLPELGIAGIELSRAGLRRSYVRDARTGRWSQAGVDAEAPKAFLKCVDRLLSLRADVIAAPGAPFELADPWQVVLIDGAAVRTTYRLGPLASDASVHGFDDGSKRGLVTSTRLVEDLSQIP